MKKQQDKPLMNKIALLVFSLFIAMPAARGEFGTQVNGTNEFNNLDLDPGANNPAPTVLNSSVNGSEGSVLQNTVFNQTLRPDNPNLNNLDVSDKYGQEGAAGSAQAGMIAAIATGTSLMAAGVPMAASIIPSVKAAGYALIAKAALEFAQAGASGGAENANRNIETSKLRFDDDNPEAIAARSNSAFAQGRQSAADRIAGQINSEGLNQLLTDRGVNSEDFIRAISAGEITSAEDIARAMGDNTSFSEEDLLKGQELAASKAGDEMDSLRIQVNEDNEDGSDPNFGGGGALGALGAGDSSIIDQGSLPGVRGAAGPHNAGSALAAASGQNGPGGLALGNLIGKLKKSGAESASALANLTIDQLHKLGLVKLRRGMNIFQKANRSYRAFGRWRDQELSKNPRVARHP